MKGRINVAISRSNPSTVYALVEADSMRGAAHAVRAPASDSAGEKTKAAVKQRLLSGLYRSEDAGKTWQWMNDVDVRPFYYSQVRVDPKLPNRVYWSSTPFNFSDDGGKTVRNGTVGIHVDHHAMWIDPNDPEHFLVGDDGGVSQTWDRGGNFEFLNRISIGQFYEVSYDMAVPYRVCGGLQDNGSWCGPSRKRSGPITNADWFTVGGGDGFYTAQDPSNPNIIYAESQGGNIRRLDYSTGESKPLVKPTWRPRYLQIEDSILVARGDTAKPVAQSQKKRLAELRAMQQKDSTDLDLRFNWNTPFFISPHAPSTIYVGAQPRAQVDEPRRRFPSDLAGSLDARHREGSLEHGLDRRHHERRHGRGDVRHDHDAGRVVRAARAAHGRHRRRQRLADARRWRGVGEPHGAFRGRAAEERTSFASSPRTSTARRSTWPSTIIARTISRRISS